MRVALLTPEHVSETRDGGGLGVYIQRIACALNAAGHEAEIFLASGASSATIEYDGVLLHRINWREHHPGLRLFAGIARRIIRPRDLYEPVEWLLRAHGLAGALERRHRLAPFQLVQSAEWVGTGLMVRRRAGRTHAVRCSAATDLYNAIEGNTRLRDRLRERLERWTLRRADIAFAPSRFVADHFRRVHDIDMRVLRPPAWLETAPAATPTVALPRRFLLHFGQLSDRKGSSLLAQALPIAWEQAPGLSMVWSGRCWEPGQVDGWRRLWGARAHRVQITGPLPRPELYAVLKRAEAAILPSQVDNLPNTVIESLMLGVPVIGTRGASIDELVEEDVTGHLVPLGDAGALAATLVKIWSRASPVRKGFEWVSAIRDDMQPEKAAAALTRLGAAGLPASPSGEGRLERAECP